MFRVRAAVSSTEQPTEGVPVIAQREEWGEYESDPPTKDLWYFRDNEIELIRRALVEYIGAHTVDSEEGEHARLVWRRLSGA